MKQRSWQQSVPQPGKHMKAKTIISNIELGNKTNIVWKWAGAFVAAVLLNVCLGAVQGHPNGALAAQGSPKGAAGQMPAYYDGELFTVNIFEVPASDPLIQRDPTINIIYATNDLDEEQDFVPE